MHQGCKLGEILTSSF